MGEAERIDLNEVACGLDPAELAEVSDFIGYLRAKRSRKTLPPLLADAPLDDEPTTDENLEAIDEAMADPHPISAEEMKRPCGLA